MGFATLAKRYGAVFDPHQGRKTFLILSGHLAFSSASLERICHAKFRFNPRSKPDGTPVQKSQREPHSEIWAGSHTPDSDRQYLFGIFIGALLPPGEPTRHP
jgi:hypothetical protein